MSKWRNKLRGEVGTFLRKYGRRGASRSDSNDRHYSRKFETQIKRMDPEEFDRLMSGEEDEEDERGGEVVGQ